MFSMLGMSRESGRPRGGLMALLAVCALTSVAQADGPNQQVQNVAAEQRGKVDIVRDGYGVPHIYSDSVFGLFYGFGYALAEDQLFQMEMLRRTSTGRVAEVFGPKYLEHDRRTRSGYSPAAMARQYAALEPDDRALFEGYAAGYNARLREVLAARDTLLPHEFTQFGFDPVEWTAFDVVSAYVSSMALRFSDQNSEIENLALLTQLRTQHGEQRGWEVFEQLRWTHDHLAPTTIAKEEQRPEAPPTFAPDSRVGLPPHSAPARLSDLSEVALLRQRSAQLAQLGGIGPDAFPHASNLWIVGPGKTTTGEAMVVSGPQMGDFSPSYLWSAGLHGAGFDLVGVGPMGSPWFIQGTNGRIAWGSTAGFGDTVDMYQEQLDPQDPHRYLFKGNYWPMERRVEVIRVKGGDPVQHEVYSTVHGPVEFFDLEKRTAYARKRSWEGTELRSLVSWVRSMKAGNFAEWRSAVSQVSLSINNYYADREGNFAYAFLGKFPRRPAQQDFRLPVQGTGEMEWQGYLSYDSNPQVLNPRQGFIANWNNKPQPNYNSSDSMYWSVVDHVDELEDLLTGASKLSTREVWDINRKAAFVDDNARYFLPLVAQYSAAWPEQGAAHRAAQLLARWDRLTVDQKKGNRTSPGYTLFHTFLGVLIETGLRPHVPAQVYTYQGKIALTPYFPTLATKVIYNALLGDAAGVPQKFDFFAGKPREQVVREALEAALDKLQTQYGNAPSSWAEPTVPHTFDTFNYADIPTTTANNELKLPAAMNRGTQNNQIVLGAQGVSYCDAMPPGQSGFVSPGGKLSAHYKDQLSLYANFECKRQWLSPEDVQANAKSRRSLQF